MDTPNTINYMISGYAIFAIVMVIYIVSLYTRWKNLKNEQQMLAESDKK
jgi:hypothetical protein